jgi:hypothetical protein
MEKFRKAPDVIIQDRNTLRRVFTAIDFKISGISCRTVKDVEELAELAKNGELTPIVVSRSLPSPDHERRGITSLLKSKNDTFIIGLSGNVVVGTGHPEVDLPISNGYASLVRRVVVSLL